MPGGGRGVVAGMGNGMVVVAEVGGHNGIVDVFKHDEVEGVIGVGFDVAGRMITGGGSVVKVWREKDGDEEEGEAEEEVKVNGVKRAKDSDSDEWEDEESSEEEKARKRKKRKKSKRLSGANGTGFSFTGLD
jgi:hypothetical protein